RIAVNLGVNERPRGARALRIRADIDGVERESGGVLRIDVVSDDLDVQDRLAGIGVVAPEFGDVDSAPIRYLPDRIVLNVDGSGLLPLHETPNPVSDRRAGAYHCAASNCVAGNERLEGPATTAGAICEIDCVAVTAHH